MLRPNTDTSENIFAIRQHYSDSHHEHRKRQADDQQNRRTERRIHQEIGAADPQHQHGIDQRMHKIDAERVTADGDEQSWDSLHIGGHQHDRQHETDRERNHIDALRGHLRDPACFMTDEQEQDRCGRPAEYEGLIAAQPGDERFIIPAAIVREREVEQPAREQHDVPIPCQRPPSRLRSRHEVEHRQISQLDDACTGQHNGRAQLREDHALEEQVQHVELENNKHEVTGERAEEQIREHRRAKLGHRGAAAAREGGLQRIDDREARERNEDVSDSLREKTMRRLQRISVREHELRDEDERRRTEREEQLQKTDDPLFVLVDARHAVQQHDG